MKLSNIIQKLKDQKSSGHAPLLFSEEFDFLVEAAERTLLEPQVHSFRTDILPSFHPLANATVYCHDCNATLHAFNNECMDVWVEMDSGNFCLDCFTTNELNDLNVT